jgi:hypothetical protein
VEDFAAILAAYQSAKEGDASNLFSIQDSVVSSLRTMERVIELLVLTGGTSAHYRKAVACLQAYRQACLLDFGSSSLDIAERFNVFMKESIKQQFKGGRHNAFWGNIVAAGLSLIYDDEFTSGRGGGVGVSCEESRLFLLETTVEAVVEVAEVKQEEEEEDDLFGDMA